MVETIVAPHGLFYMENAGGYKPAHPEIPPSVAADEHQQSCFALEVNTYEHSLSEIKHRSALQSPDPDLLPSLDYPGLSKSALALDQVHSLLRGRAVGPPHGFDLLRPFRMPELPRFPHRPDVPRPRGPKASKFERWVELWFRRADKPTLPVLDRMAEIRERTLKRADDLEAMGRRIREQCENRSREEATKLNGLRDACIAKDPNAIRLLMAASHVRHPLPEPIMGSFEPYIDLVSRIVLCTIEIPDFGALKILRKRTNSPRAKWLPVSAADRRRANEMILHSLCLRAAYLLANSDEDDWFDLIGVNAKQDWFDRATGAPRSGMIASLQATKGEFAKLDLEQVDPTTCFHHLKGISSLCGDQVAAISPIFIVNKGPEINLASIPWDDFEHLMRRLFLWEFGRGGVEVKVTRTSRDRGVDAIMFDPDPLKGGKFVLQAKQYTRPVEVAAVRDLYETVVTQGANRGILLTLDGYSPASHEFARNKPLSLVDGPTLLAMLEKHGRRYRIDPAEAGSDEPDL
jgi:hypothetical protein